MDALSTGWPCVLVGARRRYLIVARVEHHAGYDRDRRHRDPRGGDAVPTRQRAGLGESGSFAAYPPITTSGSRWPAPRFQVAVGRSRMVPANITETVLAIARTRVVTATGDEVARRVVSLGGHGA
ncbi:hypothetical protein EFW17_07465 [Halostreptopolyspora alba]|uniref:Uncharacterized protein n=1 Tax=Halostreptopolyspora alba TaxID=2487137 RepID=A0A3N0ED79_9ACTN|nr:hypothetical protein EFW17_07465 [Nocardiopsaceae bacterium YIM 96095]